LPCAGAIPVVSVCGNDYCLFAMFHLFKIHDQF
jgi:hypothetical protein